MPINSTLDTKIRLQKIIADRGYCSRRKAEDLIVAGKVNVNGQIITELGSKFLADVEIEIAGEKLSQRINEITIAFNKPRGYLSSHSDPFKGKTIFDLLPQAFSKLKIAGRLDKDSEGLMILSSNGDIVYQLSHPKFGHKKTYEILVKGIAKEEDLKILESETLELDGYKLNPIHFEILKKDGQKTWIRLNLSEGRKREIRRIMESLYFPVIYLQRTKIGELEIGNLKSGEYKELNEEEIKLALS